MKVDAEQSEYHEASAARDDFNRSELRSLRLLLRRLRFLEAQVKKNGGMGNSNNSGGAAFAEWEVEALAYALTELGFLEDTGAQQ